MTSSDKPSKPVSTEQPQEQSTKTLLYPRRSLDELRKRGVPIVSDLIISPLPRKASKGSTYRPKNLKRWKRPENYFGAEWPEYFSSGVGQSRDSDALERSNFTCMLEALGGESDTVIVVRESHWAVGWVEWIAIHQDDDKALEIADKIARRAPAPRRY
jgi:hypothetical protein